jgi:hypothetical protein
MIEICQTPRWGVIVRGGRSGGHLFFFTIKYHESSCSRGEGVITNEKNNRNWNGIGFIFYGVHDSTY